MLKGSDADRAVEALDAKEIEGRTVKVSIAQENGAAPSKKRVTLEAQDQKPTKEKGANKQDIIQKKKIRRRRGLNELFDNTGKK